MFVFVFGVVTPYGVGVLRQSFMRKRFARPTITWDAYVRLVTAFCAYELLYAFLFFLIAGAITVGGGYLRVSYAIETLAASAGLIASYHIGAWGKWPYVAVGLGALCSVVICYNALAA